MTQSGQLQQQQQQLKQGSGLHSEGQLKLASSALNNASPLIIAPKQTTDFSQQTSSREIEKQIVDKILGEGYDKRIRPAGSGPYNASRPGK